MKKLFARLRASLSRLAPTNRPKKIQLVPPRKPSNSLPRVPAWFARLRRAAAQHIMRHGALRLKLVPTLASSQTAKAPQSSTGPIEAPNSTAPQVVFVGNARDVRDGLPQAGQVVITGELVFATLQNTSPGTNFTRLVPRIVSPWHRLLRTPRRLYLWIHNDLIAAAKTTRVAFAIDGLLRYGRRTKGRVILFNGYRTSANTYLNWYRFTDGELVDIQERILPNDDARYQTEMLALLNSIVADSDTQTQLYWTDPLPALQTDKLKLLGAQPFVRIPTVTLAPRPPAWLRWGPVAIPAAALAIYILAIGTQWIAYASARGQYQAIAAKNPHQAESLQILAARQAWLQSANPMQARIAPLAAVFKTMEAHPDWKIEQIELNSPAKDQPASQAQTTLNYPADTSGQLRIGQRRPDLVLTISMPLSETLRPLDQAQQPLTELADATRLPMHVAAPPQGLTEQTTGTGKRLLLTIETAVHAAPAAMPAPTGTLIQTPR